MKVIYMNVCISWPSALSLALTPVLVRNLYLPAPAPNLSLPVLAPNSHLPALAPNLYLPAAAPNLYLLALAYNFITSPSLSSHITAMSPQFVSVFMALAYHLFYRSGLINNTSICMPILVK